MSRIKPYATRPIKWGELLSMNLSIPMRNRQYSWEKKELKQFMKILHIQKD